MSNLNPIMKKEVEKEKENENANESKNIPIYKLNTQTLLAKLSKGLMGLFMLKKATKWVLAALAMFLWCSRPCIREIKSTVDLWMFHCKTKKQKPLVDLYEDCTAMSNDAFIDAAYPDPDRLKSNLAAYPFCHASTLAKLVLKFYSLLAPVG